jgi:hypothetical protein
MVLRVEGEGIRCPILLEFIYKEKKLSHNNSL